MTGVQNREEEGVSDVNTISVLPWSQKLASQLLTAFCGAYKSSKEHSTGKRHAVSAGISDVESSFRNSFNLIGL